MNRTIAVTVGLIALVALVVASFEGAAAVYALVYSGDYDTTWAGVGLFLKWLVSHHQHSLICWAVKLWRG